MMKRLIFYNHYGVGDLFESREFVLEWMRLYGVETTTYACRYPAVFEDLPQITTMPVQPDMDMRRALEFRGDELRVNTWIGARNAETHPPGDYVLWPGVGCTVEGLYRMHNQYLREAGLPPLLPSVVNYLTNIDYTRVKLGNVNQFAEEHAGKIRVLLCNGATGSGHAANFNFAQMVALLPPTPNAAFIFTERCSIDRENVFFTDDITLRAPGESDFNAISYLSTFCDLIVGRCSGAQMPCETRQNWMNWNKTLLSFTQHRNGACFVRDPEVLGLRMRLVHSDAATPEEAAKVLERVMR